LKSSLLFLIKRDCGSFTKELLRPLAERYLTCDRGSSAGTTTYTGCFRRNSKYFRRW